MNPYRILSPTLGGSRFNYISVVCGFGRAATLLELDDRVHKQSMYSIISV
jgi:hypothetical protein